jgi:glycosyltransferase involved in cell wall biosynthesis
MIAGAEAPRIGRALASVADWAGEIIVVMNDNVADGTAEIAAACGAKVFRESWKGHVAQKNSAAQKAGSDWLLGLDADEEIPPLLRDEIIQTLARTDKNSAPAAYSVPRCTCYDGRWIRHGDWYPDRKARLWRRGLAQWGGVDPHDRLLVSGRVEKLKHDLLHHGMEDLNHRLHKAIAYSDLFARHQRACGRQTNAFEIWLRPRWRFFRSYVLRGGFRDGAQGYAVAQMIAFETFMRYTKLRETQRNDVKILPVKG